MQQFKRFRHRRIDEQTRNHYRETRLTAKDFIWPVFIRAGSGIKEDISLMPAVYRYSVDSLLIELDFLIDKGLNSILLFGVPDKKGIEQACDKTGIVQTAVSIIKKQYPQLEIITDVCLCSYTEDGHCHVGDNDLTCEILSKIALSHAQSGADIVAPSDMMDGRVSFIREALTQGGYKTKIMSYAAKFASSFYGPFRDAAACAPHSGDRKTYQMDPANGKEALDEIRADLEEGADSIIVKPALSYLDVIARSRDTFDCPIIAYNVSGEYTMLYNAVKNGFVKEDVILETLISIKRAGASRIISYFIPQILSKIDR